MSERIDRELRIPASPDEVWAVVTTDGWLADQVMLELVPGGEARFVDGEAVRSGWVEEARPPTGSEGGRLAFWWAEDEEPASRVELVLDPEDEGCTRLRITETKPLDALDVIGIPLPGSGGASYGPAMVAA